MLDNYSRVRLLTDRYRDEGAHIGYQGYIIEVYDDAYEIEFSDIKGTTIAQIVARPNEIALDEPVSDAPTPLSQKVQDTVSKDTEPIPTPVVSQRR